MNSNDTRQHVDICPACNHSFRYSNEDTWFDEHNCGYSVKLVKCKNCGTVKRIKYYEDKNLDVNNDNRFYDYSRLY